MNNTVNNTVSDTGRIPIFPLNTVLFPDGLLPLRVFEARYMDMARNCLKHQSHFGVCLIREGKEVGEPALPESVGCLASIVECDMQQLGVLQLLTRGGQRFRILDRDANGQGLVSARIELIPPEQELAMPEEYADCRRLLEMVVSDHGKAVFGEPHRLDSATWVGHRLGEILPVPAAAKQQLLEMDDSIARLAILQRFLEQRGLAR